MSPTSVITTQPQPVAGNIFDPNRIKDAITINVDGRNLNPADYSLEPDGNGIRINLVNQYSRIYEGQTVTLSYDESLIPEADRLIDYSGNLLREAPSSSPMTPH